MSYLLFLDESGHDHKTMPYEVHGGIALHVSQVWRFVQAMRGAEQEAFGAELHQFGGEIKGHKLLDKDRFRWAQQEEPMPDVARRLHAKGFLQSKTDKRAPRREEFTAYGQACLFMADRLFDLMEAHSAKIFAIAIPRGTKSPSSAQQADFLRKDFVFLLERYFYMLDETKEAGLLIMDEIENTADRRFVRCLERYFTSTQAGRSRASAVVPSPFFVASEMTYPVQAADVAIYCINLGFRLPERGMDAETRLREDRTYMSYGITMVSDLYTART
ncbi:MAG: DUF3800 domain-containing protein [Armatimonadetes bacterium]|nr:DUF3800 domain-containing protein [Armatimonadota bacterium]